MYSIAVLPKEGNSVFDKLSNRTIDPRSFEGFRFASFRRNCYDPDKPPYDHAVLGYPGDNAGEDLDDLAVVDIHEVRFALQNPTKPNKTA